jgi:predicted amidohydrolase YtcJ
MLGTDVPIEKIDPLPCIYVAKTRKDSLRNSITGEDENNQELRFAGSWNLHEALTMEEILPAYCIYPLPGAHAEAAGTKAVSAGGDWGLVCHQPAHFVHLSRDLFNLAVPAPLADSFKEKKIRTTIQ